ncbi:MAG: LPXTG cell wall anchor domain-containing protein, partial [Limosilactobacillus sp.]|uniref:LPXTG cell wall anchor domain-containing protein n=1 Tax=Limosilactobacillus sp. TaxID=2773925 RepID=UPI0026F8D1BF|nr:LPXTG cell wall anchor domain-containing protein [Limosilactobacillus sp.]
SITNTVEDKDKRVYPEKPVDPEMHAQRETPVDPEKPAQPETPGKKDQDATEGDLVANGDADKGATVEKTADVKAAPADVAKEGSAKQAKLPQTGNQTATAALALGSFVAMLGLGLAAKKRNN